MSASMIETPTLAPRFLALRSISNLKDEDHVAADRLPKRRPATPERARSTEDNFITKVAIVGSIVAITPLILLHMILYFWPELLLFPIAPN